MGKIVSLINTTPDGFVDSQYVIADAEFHEFVHGLLADSRVVGFGKNSFELFQTVWPTILAKENQPESQVRMARALTDMPKAVYSSTLKTTNWDNSRIVSTIDADEMAEFKQEGQKGLLTIGSPGLVAALTERKLVDDYFFCIQPIVAGSGSVRFFDKINLDARQPLLFVDSKPLKSGVMIIHYQRVS